MSRFPRFPRFLFAVSLLGLVAGAGCRSRDGKAPAGARTPAPAATRAPVRAAVIRPISRPIGASIAVAELDGARVAFVADEEESAIQTVDLDTRAVVSTTKLDGAPGQMLLAPDGTLFVAVRGAARVVALRFESDAGGAKASLHVVRKHSTADEPYGLALTPDGAMLLVSTIVDPGLEAFATADFAPRFATVLPRDPRSVRVSSDGTKAFVTHATGSVVSVVEVKSESPVETSTVSLEARERRRDFGQELVTKKPMVMMSKSMARAPEVRITMKRSATQGFGMAMIGEQVLVPETLVMTSDTEMIPSGYGSIAQSTLGTHVPFVARVATKEPKLENGQFSGPADKTCFEKKPECILPVAVTDDGEKAYVACLDSDEVMVIDPKRDAEHAPACRKTLEERTRVHVENPSAVAVDTDRHTLLAFSSFTRKLTVAPLAGGESKELTLPRTGEPAELVVEGRRLFHRSADARIAKNGRACASCHVDGREDGLVWPTPMGKRQTPMLAGRLDGTGPYGWNGEHPTLAVHIKSTVKNLEGTGLEARELDALAAYVASMKAPAKHAPAEGAVARGQSIFRSSEAGCASCHIEDTHFTDLETHQFGGKRAGVGFDTPSLAFVGQTAPYFHDGRFATLEALIDGCEERDTQMGHTKHLAPEDRRALVAYLRSL